MSVNIKLVEEGILLTTVKEEAVIEDEESDVEVSPQGNKTLSSKKPVKGGRRPVGKTKRGGRGKKRRIVGNKGGGNQTKKAKSAQSDEDVESEFQVENILDKKSNPDGTFLYFIKWIGWPDDSNTWEPIENLDGCEELLADFEIRWAELQIKNKSDKVEVEQTKGSPKKAVVEAKTSSIKKTTIEKEIITEISPETSTETNNVEAGKKKTTETTPIPEEKIVVSKEKVQVPSPVTEGKKVAASKEKIATVTTTEKTDDSDSNDDVEEFMEFDVLEKCPRDKIPKELVGVVDIQGTLTYLIEWEYQKENQSSTVSESDEPDRRLIKALPFKTMYPAMVIKYYEGHINFTTDPQYEEDRVKAQQNSQSQAQSRPKPGPSKIQ